MEKEGVPEDRFRDALARWPAGVTVVAVRDGGDVHATTVSSFLSVSVDPPQVLVSLSPNARVLPFVSEGKRFVVNVLSRSQRRWASIFADPFPVGPSPFGAGDPVLPESLSLLCRARSTIDVEGGVRLVVGRVEEIVGEASGFDPLIRFDRAYHGL